MPKKYLFHRDASSERAVELPPERILCNDVIFSGEFNPHNVRLWIIGNEYGALGAVWASCEQDALDELVDSNLGEAFLIDEANEDEDSTYVGNACELADLSHAWLWPAVFEVPRDLEFF